MARAAVRNTAANGGVREIAYGYVVYQLAASMLGAYAIAVFLDHFVHTNWHGILTVQAHLWSTFFAPLQDFVFGRMEKFTGQRFAPFWRDYLTVGAAAMLSFARSTLAYDATSTGNQLLRWAELLLDIVQHMFLWPVAFLRAFLAVFEKDPERAPYIVALTLTPVLYLGILFGLNAWLA